MIVTVYKDRLPIHTETLQASTFDFSNWLQTANPNFDLDTCESWLDTPLFEIEPGDPIRQQVHAISSKGKIEHYEIEYRNADK